MKNFKKNLEHNHNSYVEVLLLCFSYIALLQWSTAIELLGLSGDILPWVLLICLCWHLSIWV